MKKQILSDAIIAWMRYKRNVIKVPAYCTPEIEGYIERWSIEKLDRVVRDIELGDTLFHGDSCPFCISRRDAYDIICVGCEFGKSNGVCDYSDDNLWGKHGLREIETTPANRKRFNLIFKTLKKGVVV